MKDKSFPLKNRIWEDVYKDMTKEGWKFGRNIKEGASVLAEKWKLVESTVLKKKTPRTLLTPDLRRSILSDIEERRRREALGISQPSKIYFLHLSFKLPRFCKKYSTYLGTEP